jgi:hypothetical protein
MMRPALMRPFALITASLLVVTGTVAIAETDAERAARCAGQAQIVAQAVDLRAGGTDEAGATSRLEASDSGIDPKYAPSVSVLVGWIYTLPPEQMTAEVATAFETQCLGYKP